MVITPVVSASHLDIWKILAHTGQVGIGVVENTNKYTTNDVDWYVYEQEDTKDDF